MTNTSFNKVYYTSYLVIGNNLLQFRYIIYLYDFTFLYNSIILQCFIVNSMTQSGIKT
jgi:hypothetical protein